MTDVNTGTSYDEVPYDSVAFVETHPARLSVIARLFGLKTAPIDKCRVLELGCSMGGNIIPMAAYLPRSEFIGIELSPVQVRAGQKSIESLGLTNIQLLGRSILDVNEELGTFDYIIAHGVYSWVPDEVKDKILSICSKNLNPNGVAYVSYNTFPGWRMRGMIRDIMRYHASPFPTPEQRIGQARGLLDFLASSLAIDNKDDPAIKRAYGLMLQGEVELIRAQPNYYLLHEYLETVNEPVYFHQFMAAAEKHGLQYLGDSDFSTMLVSHLPAEVRDTLSRISSSVVQMEQYMDFVRNRLFRRTLLVHSSQAINRVIVPDLVKDLYIVSTAKPTVPEPDIHTPGALVEFKSLTGSLVSATSPLTKSAMLTLLEHSPKPLHFDQLRRLARKKISPTKVDDRELAVQDENELAANLLNAYSAAFLAFYSCSFPIQIKPVSRPKVSMFVRQQAITRGYITSPLHVRVLVDEFRYRLLPLLDGTRDRKALLAEMTKLATSGALPLKVKDEIVTDQQIIKDMVEKSIDESLEHFYSMGLMIEK